MLYILNGTIDLNRSDIMNFYKNRQKTLFLSHPKILIPQMKHFILENINNDRDFTGTFSRFIWITPLQSYYDHPDNKLFYKVENTFVIEYKLGDKRTRKIFTSHVTSRQYNRYSYSKPKYVHRYVSFNQYMLLGNLRDYHFRGFNITYE